MATRMKIAFSINDWTEQELELTTDDYTPEEVFDMLKQGKALTSVQNGGEVIMVEDNEFITVGKVISSEPGDGTHFDFELIEVMED